jgi:hypothetical protein
MSDAGRFIASQVWRHRDSVTGDELMWVQEDEEAVTTKTEAVAMIQRTIDFWKIKLRDDLMSQRGLSRPDAEQGAIQTFHRQFGTSLQEPLPRRFGITLQDLRIEF